MAVDPVLVGGVVGVVGIGAAAAYAYFTGKDATAGADLDGDGKDEVSYTFDGSNETEDDTVSRDVETQADPTPEAVKAKDGLEDVTGIGPTRAEKLRDEGYETPEDIYYASDENLKAVHGLGPRAVSNIRGDIGSIEGNGNTESDDSGEESSVETSDGGTDSDSTESGESPSAEQTEVESSENSGTDSESEADGTGDDSDEAGN